MNNRSTMNNGSAIESVRPAMAADTEDMNDEKAAKASAQETKAATEGDIANVVKDIADSTKQEVAGSHFMQVATNRLGANSLSDLVVFVRQAADTTAELVKPNSTPVKLPAKPARPTSPAWTR